MVVGNKQIDDDKKYMLLGGCFAGHVDAAVQREAHRLMEHVQASFKATGCHHWARSAPYRPGDCHGHRWQKKQKNTNKTKILATVPTVDRIQKL